MVFQFEQNFKIVDSKTFIKKQLNNTVKVIKKLLH